MAGHIPQSFIQELIERSDIVPLISERVELKRSGQNYQARCPFHDEKTPSFSVSATKQFYYCFGCGAHGNVVRFLMEYDRMEFVEAISYLATQQGMSVPTEEGTFDTKQHQQRQDSLAIMTDVSHYYEQQLKTSTEAIAYLKSRGLTGQIAKQFAVGYAPDNFDNLHGFHHHQAELIANGLLVEPKCYARFRHRIMFPIRNPRRQTIGFGARALSKEDQPKYLNSPETALFHKNQELYGLYEALQTQRQLKYAICVEGYMDVITLHQHGISQTVATLGTAINGKHIQNLLRYTHEIVFCFDGDAAGQRAAWKALTIAMPLLRDGIQFRFLFLPEKEDPDSLIRRIGSAGFMQRLKQAKALSQVFFELLEKQFPLTSLDEKTRFASEANHYLEAMPHGLYRELLLRQLAERLGLYRADLDHLNKPQRLQRTPTATEEAQVTKLNPLISKLLRMLLQEPKLALEYTQPILTPIVGNKLFNWLAQQFSNTHHTLGSLLALLPEAGTEQAVLAELASQPIQLSTEQLLTEFRDGLKQLALLKRSQQIQALQHKASSTGISLEEKQELSQLLTNQNSDPI